MVEDNDGSPEDGDFSKIFEIAALPWPQIIRVAPHMFVGPLRDGNAPYFLFEMAVEDALDRHPSYVTVTLHSENLVCVCDNGAPFPTNVEKALSHLKMYEPGHLAIVSAFSSRFDLRLWRDGDEDLIRYVDGRVASPLVRIGPAPAMFGVEVSFRPSPEVFGEVVYDRDRIARVMRAFSDRRGDVRFELR